MNGAAPESKTKDAIPNALSMEEKATRALESQSAELRFPRGEVPNRRLTYVGTRLLIAWSANVVIALLILIFVYAPAAERSDHGSLACTDSAVTLLKASSPTIIHPYLSCSSLALCLALLMGICWLTIFSFANLKCTRKDVKILMAVTLGTVLLVNGTVDVVAFILVFFPAILNMAITISVAFDITGRVAA